MKEYTQYHHKYNTYLNLKELSDVLTEKLLSEKRITILEFTEKPYQNFWFRLNEEVLKHTDNVGIRLYGYDGVWEDLSFLKILTHLKRLKIQEPELKDLNPVSQINSLISFSLENTISTKISLKPIEKFTELEELFISGNIKDFDIFYSFNKLSKLNLISVKLKDINFLKNMAFLERLSLYRCGINNLDIISEAKNLHFLYIEGFQKLNDINFISNLSTLIYLSMGTLKGFEKFPSFDNCNSLRKIEIQNIHGVNNIHIIETAPVLEEFIWYSNITCQKQEFEFLLNMKTLKNVYLNCFNTIKEFEEYEKLATQNGIKFTSKSSGKFDYLTI